MQRPRAENCRRLTIGALRPQVEVGTDRHRLADGTELKLLWRPLHNCYGGNGWALLVGCPCCSKPSRVLWQPPGMSWGCPACRPVSHRSHRRPGSRAGQGKPVGWKLAQLEAEQRRIADLLGLEQWPPDRLLWGMEDLRTAPRQADRPRLLPHRDRALRLRLNALDCIRIGLIWGIGVDQLKGLGHTPGTEIEDAMVEGLMHQARQTLKDTAWAMRRPAGDARSRQQKKRPESPPAPLKNGPQRPWAPPGPPSKESSAEALSGALALPVVPLLPLRSQTPAVVWP